MNDNQFQLTRFIMLLDDFQWNAITQLVNSICSGDDIDISAINPADVLSNLMNFSFYNGFMPEDKVNRVYTYQDIYIIRGMPENLGMTDNKIYLFISSDIPEFMVDIVLTNIMDLTLAIAQKMSGWKYVAAALDRNALPHTPRCELHYVMTEGTPNDNRLQTFRQY